ncbi:OmpH family outer membrane protein [Horticoccus luteus]|uniref:OmpH family outer membrane protein n=1 Tax=Horticoccus luteus TaxID=2862869 RepID=A0A8F9TUH3_9BACT|nr:OmpH family outer membrane protein [Horticoccus luteus]QYM78350.1 OmpH family outer membrane protein [Horticoccus luteus]
MKKYLHVLIALGVLALTAGVGRAQPALKIAVVDMAKLYDSHYKTEEQNAKLRADEQKAQEELDRLNKEGNALVSEYKELVDQSNNPTATAEAKSKAQSEAQQKLEEIQKKQNEVGSFKANIQRSLQQRLQTFRNVILEEIGKIATDVAKRRGATLLIDKAGPTLIGVPTVLYADSAYEITDDVMKEINKDRPASAPAASGAPAAGSAPAASTPPAASAPSSDGPQITVPGVTPKKN